MGGIGDPAGALGFTSAAKKKIPKYEESPMVGDLRSLLMSFYNDSGLPFGVTTEEAEHWTELAERNKQSAVNKIQANFANRGVKGSGAEINTTLDTTAAYDDQLQQFLLGLGNQRFGQTADLLSLLFGQDMSKYNAKLGRTNAVNQMANEGFGQLAELLGGAAKAAGSAGMIGGDLGAFLGAM